MLFDQPLPERSPARKAITDSYLQDETECLEALIEAARVDAQRAERIQTQARSLVETVREKGRRAGAIEAFLQEYDLSSQEGVVLMCLAEALLRVPDDETADRLIQDKLSKGQWDSHLGHSHSLFVNASTWGLMLTGRIVNLESETLLDPGAWFKRFISRSGEPVVRVAMRQAMRILGHQFVMGETIEDALKRSHADANAAYRHSFDMLGEAALTSADAERYFEAYSYAIKAIGADSNEDDLFAAPSISVKLSALHPRYQFSQRERVLRELTPRLTELACQARDAGIALTVDAEESERLELSLDVFASAFSDSRLMEWSGFGLAVQAYQKRAPAVIAWLAELCRTHNKRLPLRLVKGAYWDSEIKRAQEQGLVSYPVFTRKASTDTSYLACARRILEASDAFYPQFATHNAHTIAYILNVAPTRCDYEFQRLHGMGESLYEEVVDEAKIARPCRVYAPVGGHKDLLPYLVRRLLENGANTSFVNRIVDERITIEDIVADPVAAVAKLTSKPHPKIPLPRKLYMPQRLNSRGINLADATALDALAARLTAENEVRRVAAPLIAGEMKKPGQSDPVRNPADHTLVGEVYNATEQEVDEALNVAQAAAGDWSRSDAGVRAEMLEKAANLLESHRDELLTLCIKEAGKTLPDAIAEVREAADFCRYYAHLARQHFASPISLPGPTGEQNRLQLSGRGVFACISPWNFPLAIFVGQISAALAAGNSVIAKPAAQTPLIAMRAVQLLHEAGVAPEILQFLPGSGAVVGSKLACDPRIAGIAFTGSTETAQTINRHLAARQGAIVPFIAETGGQNAMLVDSSALLDQVVIDAMHSAFNSAGQRCSALRVLYVQEDVLPRLCSMFKGAIAELRVGDPARLSNDIGPVIDEAAQRTLHAHATRMDTEGKLIAQATLPDGLENGTFFAPRIYQVANIGILEREVFGPILHVIGYQAGTLQTVIDEINNCGYGLTLGIHSRIDSHINFISERARVGNIYVNRNMIGAVVGVQPFGGEGLSGTGPKAGGPHYLFRFATERTVSNNVAALGGNTTLLSLSE